MPASRPASDLGFLGHQVTCLDSDEAKINTLRSGADAD
jgi:UDP-glucose 6-dehydrogenase